MSARRIIVLGALSAVGEATCRRLAAGGASFALLGRGAARLETVARDLKLRGAAEAITRDIDLTEIDDAAAVLRACAEGIGGLDTVLLFYGVLGEQARAEHDAAEAQRILAVNFTSAAAWLMPAAALLEEYAAPNALLLAVSSVAGDRGRRSNYLYGAAKGALSILVQGLAHRFAARRNAPRAVVVKLGFVDSPMTVGLKKGGLLWSTPETVAPAIVAAMERGGPIVYTPFFWRWIMLAIRVAPQFLFNRLSL